MVISFKTSMKIEHLKGQQKIVGAHVVSNIPVLMEKKRTKGSWFFRRKKMLEKRVQQTEEGLIIEVLIIKWLDKDEGEAT